MNTIGVIVQEVEKVYPEVVDTNNDGFKSINYPALVTPLIEADKTETEALKAKTQLLESANDRLTASDKAKDQKIKDLEQRLERIEKYFNSK